MKPKFDINKFEKLNKEELKFECECCSIEFLGTKKYIRRVLGITKNTANTTLKFCSKECSDKSKMTGEYVKCELCKKEVYRNLKEYTKNNSRQFFCSRSCKGIEWNKNKNYGFNRSKIEEWVEEELINRYNFEILFNSRNILKSGYELDIYIPHLKLAFELNGIFHYEPIFGNDKLKVIEGKDLCKMNECESEKIKLLIIDITDSKKFNKNSDKKYLDFIIKEIDCNLGNTLNDSIILDNSKRKVVERKKNNENFCNCGKKIKKTSKNCSECRSLNNRKVERPLYEVLMIDIEEIGYKKTGEKYNVDRTTIYKWIKRYKENMES